MKRFSQLASSEKRIELLRWLCVLPAGVLAEIVMRYLAGVVGQIAAYGGWSIRGEANTAFFLGLVLFYVLPKSAFVIAGAKTAPRRRMAPAIVLAVLGIGVSLLTHVVGQHLAGNRVGTVNYAHAAAESTGLLAGAACILWQIRASRREVR